MSVQQRFQFYPGRLRQSCVAVWVLVTCFGLYQLLGLTGLALAAIYVTAGIRKNRRCRRLELVIGGSRAGDDAAAKDSGRLRSRAHSVPLSKQPLIGRPLQCWICPWCVGVPDEDGDLQWVFVDEVPAQEFARIRRRALLPSYDMN